MAQPSNRQGDDQGIGMQPTAPKPEAPKPKAPQPEGQKDNKEAEKDKANKEAAARKEEGKRQEQGKQQGQVAKKKPVLGAGDDDDSLVSKFIDTLKSLLKKAAERLGLGKGRIVLRNADGTEFSQKAVENKNKQEAEANAAKRAAEKQDLAEGKHLVETNAKNAKKDADYDAYLQQHNADQAGNAQGQRNDSYNPSEEQKAEAGRRTLPPGQHADVDATRRNDDYNPRNPHDDARAAAGKAAGQPQQPGQSAEQAASPTSQSQPQGDVKSRLEAAGAKPPGASQDSKPGQDSKATHDTPKLKPPGGGSAH